MGIVIRGQLSLLRVVLLILTLSTVTLSSALAEPLRMVTGENGVARYAKGLLKVALSKIPDEFEWDETAETSTEARIVEMLISDQLDIIWYTTSKDFENRMLPIRIPMYKGLLGYRIFMIKSGSQGKFSGIQSISDLNRISIGQGRFWADTEILESNGVEVIKVTQYDSLFHMLDGGRFDAFPRGIHEPWDEMPRWPDLQLDVEENLMLAYMNPFYFFVSKNKPELAEKVELGLRLAIEDGSFDRYFLNYPTIKSVLSKSNVKNRHIISLTNPLLPSETPLEDQALWFDPYNH